MCVSAMRIVTDYKHAQQIIIELDARIAKLEANREHWYCELCGCESCIKAEALANSEGENNE